MFKNPGITIHMMVNKNQTIEEVKPNLAGGGINEEIWMACL
jgi:hypothetical protein